MPSQPAHVLHPPQPRLTVLPDMALNKHVGARVTALDSAQLPAPSLSCTALAKVKRSNRRTPRSACKPTVAQVSFDAQDRGLYCSSRNENEAVGSHLNPCWHRLQARQMCKKNSKVTLQAMQCHHSIWPSQLVTSSKQKAFTEGEHGKGTSQPSGWYEVLHVVKPVLPDRKCRF